MKPITVRRQTSGNNVKDGDKLTPAEKSNELQVNTVTQFDWKHKKYQKR